MFDPCPIAKCWKVSNRVLQSLHDSALFNVVGIFPLPQFLTALLFMLYYFSHLIIIISLAVII